MSFELNLDVRKKWNYYYNLILCKEENSYTYTEWHPYRPHSVRYSKSRLLTKPLLQNHEP